MASVRPFKLTSQPSTTTTTLSPFNNHPDQLVLPPPPTSSSSPLLSLPQELITQILQYIFPPSHLSTLTLRSLFLRTHYRQTYMTQHPKHLDASLPILTVNRHLSNHALDILYGYPMWRCTARIAELGSQIGRPNFSRIRRMEIGFEDLALVVECLEDEFPGTSSWLLSSQETKGKPTALTNVPRHRYQNYNLHPLIFSQLEILECEGYQRSVFDPSSISATSLPPTTRFSFFSPEPPLPIYRTRQQQQQQQQQNPLEPTSYTPPQNTRSNHHYLAPPPSRAIHRARLEALNLCTLVQRIIKLHPRLNVLTQRDDSEKGTGIGGGVGSGGGGFGGADALDLSMGRVKWRLVRGFCASKDDRTTVVVRGEGKDDESGFGHSGNDTKDQEEGERGGGEKVNEGAHVVDLDYVVDGLKGLIGGRQQEVSKLNVPAVWMEEWGSRQHLSAV